MKIEYHPHEDGSGELIYTTNYGGERSVCVLRPGVHDFGIRAYHRSVEFMDGYAYVNDQECWPGVAHVYVDGGVRLTIRNSEVAVCYIETC
ncbi:MAG: hypothetical protein UY63_C0013G0003 [Parcubacteria group bacterium GW2011_GWA2_51_10]|nr:MAG: hypothetical protein UY63_C0013G0003 [Parcubacteria group bacterium GW2011_GWA2_51_10]